MSSHAKGIKLTDPSLSVRFINHSCVYRLNFKAPKIGKLQHNISSEKSKQLLENILERFSQQLKFNDHNKASLLHAPMMMKLKILGNILTT